MNGMGEAPGKVWFFELAEAVIDADRCVRCGACVCGVPVGLARGERRRSPVPREDVHGVLALLGLLSPWRAALRGDVAEGADRTMIDADLLTGEPGEGLGVIIESFAAKVRPDSQFASARSQDGGVVSAVLLAALEVGDIDGALVARQDPATPWRAVPLFNDKRGDRRGRRQLL